MAKVFISHSSRDSLIAAQIRTWLVDDRHDVFLDEDPERGRSRARAGSRSSTHDSGGRTRSSA